MLGAHDYLVKPFAADELRLRVKNTLDARRRIRTEALRGVTGLAGDAAMVPVPDVLTMLELTRRTGVVELTVGNAIGHIVLVDGRLTHAEVGGLSGDEAFYILLQYHAGLYRFEPAVPAHSPVTIDRRVSELLLASAAREDYDQNELLKDRLVESTITTTSASLRELGGEKRALDLRGHASAESPVVANLLELTGRLAIAIADPQLLGDLTLADAVAASQPAFRVELWCPRSDGIAGLLALAARPGFQLLAAALGDGARRLHLQIETPSASIVVSLIDLDSPLALPEVEPHALIVMPAHGELIALAPHRLAEICGRLERSHRPVVAALGGTALHQTIAQLVQDDRASARFVGIAAAALDDLRDLIGRVIRQWTTSR